MPIKPPLDIEEPELYDEFIDSFCGSGSIIIECRCGRTHVACDEINYLEQEEIDELIKLEKSNPDKVIRWPFSSISWTWINGEQVVFDCPCGYDKMICFFIEEHYTQILKFIEKIVKSERTDVKRKEKLLRAAQGEK